MAAESPSEAALAALLELNDEVATTDGAPPFNDQALIDARRGTRVMLESPAGIALVTNAADADPEAELAIRPDHRRQGEGSALAQRVRDHFAALGTDGFKAWAHGDHPGAAAIAERMGMRKSRELLQLRASVPADAQVPGDVRAFTAADAEAWVLANAQAFASHPEQGKLTLDDLADRRAEDWHSDDNLLLHESDGAIDAFTWLKPQGDVIELYAVGVVPDAQGRGLGSLMMQATFGRMRELGGETAHLYVEGDNTPALELYRKGGFTRWAIDVQYST